MKHYQYILLQVKKEELVFSYYKIREQLDSLGELLLAFIHKPKYLVSFLQPGRSVYINISHCYAVKRTLVSDDLYYYRLLFIKHNDKTFGWAAVVNFHKQVKKEKNHEEKITYTIEVLMNVCKEAAQSKDIFKIKPAEAADKGEMQASLHCAPSLPSLTPRSEEHTSELQSRPHISYAVFCLKKKKLIFSLPTLPQTHILPNNTQ